MIDVPFLLLGFGLGVRHAADPDHVAALSNFLRTSRGLPQALSYAGLWGLGHSVSFIVVGVLVIRSGVAPPPVFDEFVQALVGLMLVGLGVRSLLARPVDVAAASAKTSSRDVRWLERVKTVAVGVVHGLGGSAAVALLLLTSQTSHSVAFGYLVLFGLGTVVGMIVVTAALLFPLLRLAAHVGRFGSVSSLAPGLLSVALGAWLLLEPWAT